MSSNFGIMCRYFLLKVSQTPIGNFDSVGVDHLVQGAVFRKVGFKEFQKQLPYISLDIFTKWGIEIKDLPFPVPAFLTGGRGVIVEFIVIANSF